MSTLTPSGTFFNDFILGQSQKTVWQFIFEIPHKHDGKGSNLSQWMEMQGVKLQRGSLFSTFT